MTDNNEIPWGPEYENDGSAMRKHMRKLNKKLEKLEAENGELNVKVQELRNTILVDRQIPASMKATINELKKENSELREKVVACKRIKEWTESQGELPHEFQKVFDDNFWELLA